MKTNKSAKLTRAWDLYILLIPALILLIVFSYGPLYGLLIAFKDYSVTRGIWGSKWVGLKHILRFVESYNFFNLLRNTLTLSLYSLLAGFPIPIILALLINKLNFRKYKSFVQTASYAPHFISTVVLVGMLRIFFFPGTGLVNHVMTFFGGPDFDFFGSADAFKHLYVLSDVWKTMGWGSIIYIAALSGIDPSLYESARCDGANKFHMLIHIDIPSIVPTIVTLLILNVGSLMNVGYEKAFLMQTPLNTEASEIISTYVYKVGLQDAQYSFSTAVNVFNSAVNCLLLVAVNRFAKKVGETSLW
ncbi:MAG: ABC transporter permease subunit [Clostridiales bacterium]|jgi:putative aldouronate transport system permease protein|nr:ABC transporter permease subunit [Clostridiales bacterium]